MDKLPEPRSYTVKTDKGTILRRNRKHLLKTQETFYSDTESYSSLIYNEDTDYDSDATIPAIGESDPDIETEPETGENTETNYDPDSESESSTESDSAKTRGGRHIRKPNYLKDYSE